MTRTAEKTCQQRSPDSLRVNRIPYFVKAKSVFTKCERRTAIHEFGLAGSSCIQPNGEVTQALIVCGEWEP